MLTYFGAGEIGVLDETSKDLDSLKGSFGYALRGKICDWDNQVMNFDHIPHLCAQRVSALVLYTLDGGFLDWAFTPGNFNKDYFLHVTTENYVDWGGVRRRPMLVCL